MTHNESTGLQDTVYLVYPERRHWRADRLIDWAADLMSDEAIDAHVATCPLGPDAEHVDLCTGWQVATPSLDEALDYLADLGEITIGRTS